MTRKNILILTIYLIFNGISANAQGLLKINNPVRLMTYNVRLDTPDDLENVWANRKSRLFNVIRFNKADIFCLQEPLPNQINDLQQAFPDFSYYGVGREDGQTKGEYCPIFYDKRRFSALENGTFWLSETPEIPGSKGWYATLPRIVSWVKMEDFLTGLTFYLFNTHFDHSSQNARDQSAILLIKKIQEIATDAPIIITGDFNDGPSSKPYKTIIENTSGLELKDAVSVSEYPHHGPSFTFVGFDFIGVPGRIIDYIFVNDDVDVTWHATLTDNWDGVYPSDHLPVLIEFEIK
jgi:endonuclease/exonuclease/phosphatase family metal-dependent hydrolase